MLSFHPWVKLVSRSDVEKNCAPKRIPPNYTYLRSKTFFCLQASDGKDQILSTWNFNIFKTSNFQSSNLKTELSFFYSLNGVPFCLSVFLFVIQFRESKKLGNQKNISVSVHLFTFPCVSIFNTIFLVFFVFHFDRVFAILKNIFFAISLFYH